MKQKTVKSAKKRVIQFSSKGKIIRRNLSAQHLVAGKSKRTRHASSKRSNISKADKSKIKKLIPYR